MGLSQAKLRSILTSRYSDNAARQQHDYEENKPLCNKTIVITGAAGGIGRSIANVVLPLGATVVAMDVDADGLDSLMQSALKNGNGEQLRILKTDHASFASIRSSSDAILEEYCEGIDILVNNAGISYSFGDDEMDLAGETAQGVDLLFGINYLSHFLLTELLLPLLKKRPGGRVVQVTSGFHYMVDGSDLRPSEGEEFPAAARSSRRSERHVSRAYANSKLAQIWHARALSRRLVEEGGGGGGGEGSGGPSVVCACPSWVGTGIAGEGGRDFLARYAFRAEGCGPGITSVLNAMFRPEEELGDDVLGGRGTRYVGNSRVVENLAPFREVWMTSDFVTRLGWRDGIVKFFSLVILIFQQTFYDDFIIQETSPDACNIQGQDELYIWSKKLALPWLT